MQPVVGEEREVFAFFMGVRKIFAVIPPCGCVLATACGDDERVLAVAAIERCTACGFEKQPAGIGGHRVCEDVPRIPADGFER